MIKSYTFYFVKNDQIQIQHVDTYQGRVSGSCNGCTVIASLLVIHHLCNDEKELLDRSHILMIGKKDGDKGSISNGSYHRYENSINPS